MDLVIRQAHRTIGQLDVQRRQVHCGCTPNVKGRERGVRMYERLFSHQKSERCRAFAIQSNRARCFPARRLAANKGLRWCYRQSGIYSLRDIAHDLRLPFPTLPFSLKEFVDQD